jgi:hypothetical protein
MESDGLQIDINRFWVGISPALLRLLRMRSIYPIWNPPRRCWHWNNEAHLDMASMELPVGNPINEPDFHGLPTHFACGEIWSWEFSNYYIGSGAEQVHII